MSKKLLLPFIPTVFLGLILVLIPQPHDQIGADVAPITPLPPTTNADGRLGVCYGFIEDPIDSGQRPYLDLMYSAGARHDRWDFNWSVIQADGPDQWNLSGHERIVRAENQKGVAPLGILLFTPSWASTCTEPAGWLQGLGFETASGSRDYAYPKRPLLLDALLSGHTCPPINLYQSVFINGQINPDNYWGYFVYQIARHFDGITLGDPSLRVDAWEIWNEPDWDLQWMDSPTATADYCRLLQVAYTAIKGDGITVGGNPNATVLFGGLHYWANPDFYKEVLDCLAAADPGGFQHNHFFDVMSVHLYSRSDQPYHVVNVLKSDLTARGMNQHPIWLTESGAPLYGDASPGQLPLDKHDYYVSVDEQAAYVIQSYANALAAGVERYYLFRAHDYDMWEPFGLIRNDQSLRPAYVAYQVAAEYLQGENQVTRVSTEQATRVSLWGTPRGKVSVLWNRTPNPVTYTLAAAMPTAMLVDRWGTTRQVSAVNNVYDLPLPAATANLVSNPNDYFVGGAPLIVIETDTDLPTSHLAPLPEVHQRSAITLTWTAEDASSGIWYTVVQASTFPDGPWTTIASWPQTQTVSQTVYYGEPGTTYYFRVRARDRVGNWEPWSPSYDARTTIGAAIELRWGIDRLFNDSNRNGQWDLSPSISTKPEITLTHVSMRFLDERWDISTATVGGSWHFTETLAIGSYTFIAEWTDSDGTDWLYLEPIELDGTENPRYAPHTTTIGLLPRHGSYLPIFLSITTPALH
jgi:hypothetical protein